jgi:LmbE family N-acetylglucosaminyl deacetylase
MPLKVLCIGAHPDDCEGSAGGTALLMRERGDEVTFVSVTDGRRGHYLTQYLDNPALLIERRRQESRAATEPFGISFETLGIPDGEVYVDRASTEAMIRLLRRARPDLVLLNRPGDYHRDHRYTAQLVLDASYMLTVPFLCPDVPALATMPVFAYWQDRFTEGGAFRTDVVVPIDRVIERKRDMMLAHESQYLEWLPHNADPGSALYGLPEEPAARRTAVGAALIGRYENGGSHSEAFQISEYGRRPSPEELARIFPI